MILRRPKTTLNDTAALPGFPPGLSRRAQEAERERATGNTPVGTSVNLARAVRISGDGGQEGRHLAPKKGVQSRSDLAGAVPAEGGVALARSVVLFTRPSARSLE